MNPNLKFELFLFTSSLTGLLRLFVSPFLPLLLFSSSSSSSSPPSLSQSLFRFLPSQLHVHIADESARAGFAAAMESYLDIEAIFNSLTKQAPRESVLLFHTYLPISLCKSLFIKWVIVQHLCQVANKILDIKLEVPSLKTIVV